MNINDFYDRRDYYEKLWKLFFRSSSKDSIHDYSLKYPLLKSDIILIIFKQISLTLLSYFKTKPAGRKITAFNNIVDRYCKLNALIKNKTGGDELSEPFSQCPYQLLQLENCMKGQLDSLILLFRKEKGRPEFLGPCEDFNAFLKEIEPISDYIPVLQLILKDRASVMLSYIYNGIKKNPYDPCMENLPSPPAWIEEDNGTVMHSTTPSYGSKKVTFFHDPEIIPPSSRVVGKKRKRYEIEEENLNDLMPEVFEGKETSSYESFQDQPGDDSHESPPHKRQKTNYN